MRVIVKMHRRCVEDMQAWLDRSPGAGDDRRALVRVAIAAMKAELARTGGRIPSATFRDDPPPPSWWWRFTSDCWVRFEVTSRWRFLSRSKVVEVIGFESELPS